MEMVDHPTRHVAIVGGGMTGLAAAHYLQKAIHQHKLPIRFTLIESSQRLGGKIHTHKKDGYVIEEGPDSFLERKRHTTDLAKELGLADELVNNEVGQAFIYHQQELHPVPAGSIMGVPTEMEPFLNTPLLSTKGKARGLEDLILPSGSRLDDQSVGHFFRSRFGDEMVDRIIEPLVSGVYGNPIDSLSLEATYPQYQNLLLQYGSLIRGLKEINHPSTRSKGLFQTLRSGLGSFVEKIEQSLPVEAILKNNELKRLIKRESGGYRLLLKNGRMLHADVVILTTPYPQTQKALQPYLQVDPLNQGSPTSIATVAIGFSQQAVNIHHQGTGFIVPRNEDLQISACTWVHKKWPHMTPEGKVLLRSFVGRADGDDIVNRSDEEILQIVLQDLKQIHGIQITGDPELVHIHRWKKARPAYEVGHKKWVDRLYQQLHLRLPNVYLAGSYYRGIGLPDCVEQGKQAVEQTIDSLKLMPA